jgi:hypothetical protein
VGKPLVWLDEAIPNIKMMLGIAFLRFDFAWDRLVQTLRLNQSKNNYPDYQQYPCF